MTLLNIVFPTLSIGIKGTDSLDMKHMLPQNPPRSCAPALDPFMGTDCHLLVISNATANHTDLLISHWGANLNSPQPHVKHLRISLEINSNRRYLATYSPVTGRLGSFAGPLPTLTLRRTWVFKLSSLIFWRRVCETQRTIKANWALHWIQHIIWMVDFHCLLQRRFLWASMQQNNCLI